MCQYEYSWRDLSQYRPITLHVGTTATANCQSDLKSLVYFKHMSIISCISVYFSTVIAVTVVILQYLHVSLWSSLMFSLTFMEVMQCLSKDGT